MNQFTKRILFFLMIGLPVLSSCKSTQSRSALKDFGLDFEEGDEIVPNDSDNDAVTDFWDACLATPPEEIKIVDEKGCSKKDEDKDGVLDAYDRCPDSIPGESVFKENGCQDHWYDTSVELHQRNTGNWYKTVVSFHSQTYAIAQKTMKELLEYWNPGGVLSEHNAKIDRIKDPNFPGIPCLNGSCDGPRPKGLDDFGKRFGFDYGNPVSAAGATIPSPNNTTASPEPPPASGTYCTHRPRSN